MGTRIKKAIIVILLLLSICGCKSCRTPDPIDYYNEIKLQFGESCLIRFASPQIYYVKDGDGKFWIVTLRYRGTEEGVQLYITDKELIFTQE